MRLRSASPCEASKLASPKKARQEFRSIPVDSLVRDTGGGGKCNDKTRPIENTDTAGEKLSGKPFAEVRSNAQQVGRQQLVNLLGNVLRHASIEGFGDAAGDTGKSVAVTSKRHGIAYGVFVGIRIEEADDGLGHSPLA